MPYTRIWIHLIWTTKNRQPVLKEDIRTIIFTHIKENSQRKSIYLDFINGYSEHVHALISIKAEQSISQVTHLLKGESSFWINKNKLTPRKFEWQEEYIAVSVSESMVGKVREYIRNQAEHHKRKSFSEEYQEFLDKYGFAENSKIRG